MSNSSKTHQVFHGMQIGESQDAKDEIFDANYPHTYCRICGEVYQSRDQRKPNKTLAEEIGCVLERKAWSRDHAGLHSEKEHQRLAASQCYATPEATIKLCSYGIIPASDIAKSPEHADAARQAPRSVQAWQ